MPSRKPTTLKKAQGTLQKCRTNPNEPEPQGSPPGPPEWLSETQAESYRQAAAALEQMGVATSVDGQFLELLAVAHADFREAVEAIRKEGKVYEYQTEFDRRYSARPEVAQGDAAWRRTFQALKEAGLTPASRAKVSAVKPQKNDDAEYFFGQGLKVV